MTGNNPKQAFYNAVGKSLGGIKPTRKVAIAALERLVEKVSADQIDDLAALYCHLLGQRKTKPKTAFEWVAGAAGTGEGFTHKPHFGYVLVDEDWMHGTNGGQYRRAPNAGLAPGIYSLDGKLVQVEAMIEKKWNEARRRGTYLFDTGAQGPLREPSPKPNFRPSEIARWQIGDAAFPHDQIEGSLAFVTEPQYRVSPEINAVLISSKTGECAALVAGLMEKEDEDAVDCA